MYTIRQSVFEGRAFNRSAFFVDQCKFMIAVVILHKKGEVMETDSKLKGLRGWLILVGIGVVVTPIRLLVTSIPIYLPIFKDGTWELVTTKGSEFYHVLWGPLLVGEMFYNICILAAAVYLIYLFFSKHYMFPKFYMGIIAATLIFIPLDAWVVSIIFPDEPMFDPETTKEFASSVISAVIWVPYMLNSKRVKATFVEKQPADLAA